MNVILVVLALAIVAAVAAAIRYCFRAASPAQRTPPAFVASDPTRMLELPDPDPGATCFEHSGHDLRAMRD